MRGSVAEGVGGSKLPLKVLDFTPRSVQSIIKGVIDQKREKALPKKKKQVCPGVKLQGKEAVDQDLSEQMSFTSSHRL